MSHTLPGHPPTAQLSALVLGLLGEQEATALGAHVWGCAVCLEVIEQLGEDPDPFLSRLRSVRAEAEVSATSGAGRPDGSDGGTSNLGPDRSGPAGEEGQGAWPTIPGYEILEELGRGGMGVVYKARQVKLNRLVALKLIRGDQPDPEERVRFKAEAEALARLQHPHIVQIYEVGEAAGRPYCALELVEGGSLARKLDGQPLPARTAAHLVEALAEAMQLARSRNLVHRDLKPANILLASGGRKPPVGSEAGGSEATGGLRPPLAWEPKITDFGLARQLESDSGLTETGVIMGTPSYMSPEQAGGRSLEVGPATDIYALGAILYECLTGRPPFRGATGLETLDQVRHQEPTPPSRCNRRVPRDLETICLKCLRKQPERRYPSASALADDLRRFLRGEPITARPTGRAERAAKWVRRNPVVAVLIAAVVLVGSAGVAGVLWEWRDAERRRGEADTARLGEAEQRRLARHAFLSLRLDQNLDLCRQGETVRGLFRLVKDLEYVRDQAPEAADLEHALRANLAAWGETLHTLRDVLPRPERSEILDLGGDGKTFWAVGPRHALRLWDAGTGRPLTPSWPFDQPPRSAVLSPDGKCAVVFLPRPPAQLRDVTTGKVVEVPLDEAAAARPLAVFSPDGRTLLTGGPDNTVRLWDTTTRQPVGPPLSHTGLPRVAAFSADGKLVLTGSDSGWVRLWDAATAQMKGELLLDDGSVRGLAFHRSGRRCALAGTRHVQLWEIDLGKPAPLARVGFAGGNSIVPPAFGPDGRELLTCGPDQVVRLWDPGTGEPLRQTPPLPSPVNRVVFAPNGRLFATANFNGAENRGEVRLWETASATQVGSVLYHPGQVPDLAFRADGKALLTCGEDQPGGAVRNVRLWAVSAWEPRGEVATPFGMLIPPLVAPRRGEAPPPEPVVPPLPSRRPGPAVEVVVAAPDGRSLLTLVGGGGVYLYDHQTHSLRNGTAGPPRPVSPRPLPLFSPDSRTFLLATPDHKVRCYETATGRFLSETTPCPKEVLALAFTADGRRFATGSADGAARLRDASMSTKGQQAGGRAVGGPLRHQQGVTAVAFSPDGRTLLTGSLDGSARLWNAESGEPLGAPLWAGGNILGVAFGRDGRFLTLQDSGETRLWAAGQAVGTLKSSGVPLSAWFSPDGSRILAKNETAALEVWDVAAVERAGAGAAVGPLAWTVPRRPGRRVVEASPDGRFLVTESADRTVQLWDAATGKAVGAARVLDVPPRTAPLGHRLDENLGLWTFDPRGRWFATRREDRAWLWSMPSAVEGDVERVRLWVEVLTGVAADGEDEARPLPAADWLSRRRRLEELGGPPLP